MMEMLSKAEGGEGALMREGLKATGTADQHTTYLGLRHPPAPGLGLER
jgi:hypothetical protein